MDSNNSSGTNTTLIVIVLLILVGLGVWYFTSRGTEVSPEESVGVDVNLTFPEGSGEEGGAAE